MAGWSAISFIINFHFSNFSATAHGAKTRGKTKTHREQMFGKRELGFVL